MHFSRKKPLLLKQQRKQSKRCLIDLSVSQIKLVIYCEELITLILHRLQATDADGVLLFGPILTRSSPILVWVPSSLSSRATSQHHLSYLFPIEMNISPNLDANHTILYSIYAVDSSNEVLQLVIVEQNDGVNGDDQTSISQTFLLSFKIQSLYELELKGILKLDGGQSTTDNDFPSLLKSLRFANGKERREFAAVLRYFFEDGLK